MIRDYDCRSVVSIARINQQGEYPSLPFRPGGFVTFVNHKQRGTLERVKNAVFRLRRTGLERAFNRGEQFSQNDIAGSPVSDFSTVPRNRCCELRFASTPRTMQDMVLPGIACDLSLG